MIAIKYPLAGCVAAAALGAVAAVGVAHAQSYPGGQSSSGRSSSGSQASQQQQLHDALHLTPRQETAWRTFTAAQQPPPDQAQQMQAMSQMQLGSMTTPQRLDFISQAQNLQTSIFRRNADATRAFYATLTPQQQRTFDQITAPPSRGSSQGRSGYPGSGGSR